MKKNNLYKIVLQAIAFSQATIHSSASIQNLSIPNTPRDKESSLNHSYTSEAGLTTDERSSSNNNNNNNNNNNEFEFTIPNNSRLLQATKASLFKKNVELSKEEKDQLKPTIDKYYPDKEQKIHDKKHTVYTKHTKSSIRKKTNFTPEMLEELDKNEKDSTSKGKYHQPCAKEPTPYKSAVHLDKTEAAQSFQSIYERTTESHINRKEAIKKNKKEKRRLKKTKNNKKERNWNPNFSKATLENQDLLPLEAKANKKRKKSKKTKHSKNKTIRQSKTITRSKNKPTRSLLSRRSSTTSAHSSRSNSITSTPTSARSSRSNSITSTPTSARSSRSNSITSIFK